MSEGRYQADLSGLGNFSLSSGLGDSGMSFGGGSGYSLLGNVTPATNYSLGYEMPSWLGTTNGANGFGVGSFAPNPVSTEAMGDKEKEKPNAKMDAMVKALAALLGGGGGTLPWAYAASVGTKTPFALQDPYKGKGANFRSLLGRYLAGG